MRIILCIQILLSALLLSVFPSSTYATSITDALPLTPEPINGVYQKQSSAPKGELIIAFDASEEMGILLVTCYERSSEKHLWYMNKDGTVSAVFQFECNGGTGIAWDGQNICVFYSRGHLMEMIDCSGRFIECYRLTETNYTTDQAWKELAYRSEKQVATGTYILRKSGLSPLEDWAAYSELVFVDHISGREQTLYKAGTFSVIQSWLSFGLILGFILLIITGMRRQHKKYYKPTQ